MLVPLARVPTSFLESDRDLEDPKRNLLFRVVPQEPDQRGPLLGGGAMQGIYSSPSLCGGGDSVQLDL
ncbi:UNVERIFIED_CONTAM: hypothetical protein K2H54_063977, partial [Gekko kuhli]